MTDQTRNPALGLIALIVFIDMAGIGLILPVMPGLVVTLASVSTDRAAEIGGWLLFAYAVMQFLFAPVIGGLSDRYGRRPVLLWTLAALGVDYLLMAWAPTLVWLFVGRMISGVMGATWAAANSCVADCVAPHKRGAAFGVLGGAGASGFVLGPMIGGGFGMLGERVPFLAAALLCLAGVVYGWFRLRETLPADKRRSFDWRRANPFGSIVQMANSPLVIGCLAAIFFMQLAAQSQLSVWGYYGILKFGWTPFTIGWTIALFGILLALAQGVLAGMAMTRFGAVHTARISLLFGIPSYLILAFAGSTTDMVLGILVGSLGALTFPAMQSLMTLEVAEDGQGELQGAIASMISLTSVIGPPIMAGLFGHFADGAGYYFPGAPFILAAALLSVGAAILAATLRRFGRS